MSFASKFNKGALFTYDISNIDLYFKLKDLGASNHIFPVRALFINTKGRYADHPQVACDGYFVSLPAHLTDTAKEILKDEEAVKAINDGVVGFMIYAYQYMNGKEKATGYSVKWLDLPENWQEDPFTLPMDKAHHRKERDNGNGVEQGEETPFDEVE